MADSERDPPTPRDGRGKPFTRGEETQKGNREFQKGGKGGENFRRGGERVSSFSIFIYFCLYIHGCVYFNTCLDVLIFVISFGISFFSSFWFSFFVSQLAI